MTALAHYLVAGEVFACLAGPFLLAWWIGTAIRRAGQPVRPRVRLVVSRDPVDVLLAAERERARQLDALKRATTSGGF